MSRQQTTYTSYYYPPQKYRRGHGVSQSKANAPRRPSESPQTPCDVYSGRPRKYDSNDSLVPGGDVLSNSPSRKASGRIPRPLPDSQYSSDQNNRLNARIESTMTVLRPPSNQPSSRRTSSNPHPLYQEQLRQYSEQSSMDRPQSEQPSSPDHHHSRQRGHPDSEDPGPVIEEFESDDGEGVKPKMRLLTWLDSSVRGGSRRD
jgi:hypothetical protein